jgi:hypothetical protein
MKASMVCDPQWYLVLYSIVLPQLRKRVAFACIGLHAPMLILSVICQDYDIQYRCLDRVRDASRGILQNASRWWSENYL